MIVLEEKNKILKEEIEDLDSLNQVLNKEQDDMTALDRELDMLEFKERDTQDEIQRLKGGGMTNDQRINEEMQQQKQKLLEILDKMGIKDYSELDTFDYVTTNKSSGQLDRGSSHHARDWNEMHIFG